MPARELLLTIPYFQALDGAAVEQLAEQSTRRVYGANEQIFIEGDATSGLWMIERGRVKIYKLNQEGQEHVLQILGEGGTFNDIGVLDGGGNPANAAALSEAVLYVLPAEAMRSVLIANPQFAYAVIRALSGRVRMLVSKIEDLTLYSVTVRLARFLIKQRVDPQLAGPGVTRTAIAAHIGTTPQTISVALRELESAGAITFDRQNVYIVDDDILHTIAMI